MIMDYRELLEKYNRLLKEVNRLQNENRRLSNELRREKSRSPEYNSALFPSETNKPEYETETDDRGVAVVNNESDSFSKIRLFMSLFRGREDVYAKRWENEKKGTAGYSPICVNQWRSGVCRKPRIPCSKCPDRAYEPLNGSIIEKHLRGRDVIGLYPMLPDETCCFLAMDFDEAGWESYIAEVRTVCRERRIPIAVERSRSGMGGHVWFFFEHPVPAISARTFGTTLLTLAMNRRHEIHFTSYDRLFPSQDTLPEGGLGNLIALPLQKTARLNSNSEFIDEDFRSYPDQWAYLSTLGKITQQEMKTVISDLSSGNDLGVLKIDEEEKKPWESSCPKNELNNDDFPPKLEIVRANMLYIPKAGISNRALNRLKRLAAFKNPLFYRQQAMRLPAFGIPRIISCSDETENYIGLPRGCEPDLLAEIRSVGPEFTIIDKTFGGKPIDVTFNGMLREEQASALELLLQSDNGILCGTTAFGKTVVAIRLIAERKVNTLILVDRISLLDQWWKRLSEFLIVNEIIPATPSAKKGRKKIISPIGRIGGGKDTAAGIIDIAVMQSLCRSGKIKSCVRDYGMIIADECHHASAFSYEQILKTASAKYVYGLTATPTRKDGHHPILFMQCGPVRYRDNPVKQAENRPFDHYIIPRFTSLRTPLGMEQKNVTIQEVYRYVIDSDFRNQQIIDDVLMNYRQGRTGLVLTLRTAHVELFCKNLEERIPDVIGITGRMGRKTTAEMMDRISSIPPGRNFVLVSTGHFIGEGFDEPRLDTLFLAMPVSWKGTLQQYAGRLHRLYRTKKEVRIYDYVDIHITMLEKMYRKRLNGYASMGYKAKGDEIMKSPLDIIYDQDSFLPVFTQDCIGARKEIIIVSPFIRKHRTSGMIDHITVSSDSPVRPTVVTRPMGDFPEKDHTAWQKAMDVLAGHGIHVLFRSNIHQKFAVVDQKIVWYGSINLLSFGKARESIMRIESTNIANELIKSIDPVV